MNTLLAGPGARPYGILLILIGVTALIGTREIRQRSHLGDADPGPRFLPQAMAGGMIGGGAILVIGSLFRRREPLFPSPGTPGEGGGEGRAKGEMPESNSSSILHPSSIPPGPHPDPLPAYRARGWKLARGDLDVFLLLISLPIYLLAMTAAGFFVSTWVYSTLMMIRLRMRPLLAVLLSTGMMVVVWALFVWQFRVVLPRGPDWMPI